MPLRISIYRSMEAQFTCSDVSKQGRPVPRQWLGNGNFTAGLPRDSTGPLRARLQWRAMFVEDHFSLSTKKMISNYDHVYFAFENNRRLAIYRAQGYLQCQSSSRSASLGLPLPNQSISSAA
jgi:hypothetical protein